ncbi:MAG: hypothetical protein JW790_03845 [Dehalococcoidales bacterium]|nr:hypothetical protein [Dehalococcoidales bacterium]
MKTDQVKDVIEMLAGNKEPDLAQAVACSLVDSHLRSEILKGMLAKNETYRYNCYKVLFNISSETPQVLYPEWDYFVELLSSPNSYHRMAAANIIANLVKADSEDRFEGIFDRYFGLLDDKSLVVAIYTAQNAGKIAAAKTGLRDKITARLLAIDSTHHAQDRKDLIKAGAIESFGEFFNASPDKERILAFVREQLACKSPKTRKLAKGFLSKHA